MAAISVSMSRRTWANRDGSRTASAKTPTQQRAAIYQLSSIRAELEAPARVNLERRIVELGGTATRVLEELPALDNSRARRGRHGSPTGAAGLE
jgi:hypothetical protein